MSEVTHELPWRHLWRLIAFQPWTYLLVIVTKLFFITLLPHAAGLLTRQFFDGLTGQAAMVWGSMTWGIHGLLWLLVGIGVARAVAAVVDTVGNRLFRHPLGALLRKNLLTHLFSRPAAQALTISPSEAVSRLRDDVIVTVNMLYMTTFLVANLLFALIAIVVMVRIDPWVTALVVGPLLSVVVITNWLRKRMEQMFQASRITTDQITNFIGETFGAIQAVQVATAEAHVLARFQTLNEARRVAMVRNRLINTLLEAVFRNITSVGSGLILLAAARSIQAGSFTIGDFVLFAFYLGANSEAVYIIGMTLTEFRQASVAFARLAGMLQDASPTTLVEHGPVYQIGSQPIVEYPVKTAADRLESIEVRNLSYCYPGSNRGIYDISFTLPHGSLTVITGEVGAGKTTLLKVLLGLLPRDSGAIYWNGKRVTNPAAFFVPPRAAYTAQTPRLFSDTLRENILLGWPATATTLTQAIDTVVLTPDLVQLAAGLETQVGPRGVKLSGGQVQRVAAARMLVRDAELLLFDDLSSALDVETETRLWQHLLAQSPRPTCLAISHRPLVLQRADQVLVIQAGRLISVA
ncbi:MAG: ABC transporter ATP-binding protein [Caldilinea sp. CFX5]|nr:ABC transporter ATP-binding protein [Caldilinea sp. CFX5]